VGALRPAQDRDEGGDRGRPPDDLRDRLEPRSRRFHHSRRRTHAGRARIENCGMFKFFGSSQAQLFRISL